jgi:hypothetical protein
MVISTSGLADNDGDGLLTLQEFMETMNLRSVQHYLKVLDVTVNDSRNLAPYSPICFYLG